MYYLHKHANDCLIYRLICNSVNEGVREYDSCFCTNDETVWSFGEEGLKRVKRAGRQGGNVHEIFARMVGSIADGTISEIAFHAAKNLPR